MKNSTMNGNVNSGIIGKKGNRVVNNTKGIKPTDKAMAKTE